MASELSRASAASHCELIQLRQVDEPRGSLCVVEVEENISFPIERVYWIFDVPDCGERAHHAHRVQHELLVAVQGRFTVHCDDGVDHQAYTLDSPNTGLLIPPMVFHYLVDFSPGTVCLVLASGPYDRSELVEGYGDFREAIART